MTDDRLQHLDLTKIGYVVKLKDNGIPCYVWHDVEKEYNKPLEKKYKYTKLSLEDFFRLYPVGDAWNDYRIRYKLEDFGFPPGPSDE